MMSLLFIRLFLLFLFLLPFDSHAALVARDLDGSMNNGHEAVYDDVLNITWLFDANLAASNTFGIFGISSLGQMNWSKAEAYIAAMNADNGGVGYLGVNTWRLPTVTPVNGASFNYNNSFDGSTDVGMQLSAPVHPIYNPSGQSSGFTGSELAYHYYNNLGGIGRCSGVGAFHTHGCVDDTNIAGFVNATNTAYLALFSRPQFAYWTGTNAQDSAHAFIFSADSQVNVNKSSIGLNVWAVASGDVAASMVPAPTAIVLFLSGLAVLFHLKFVKNLS